MARKSIAPWSERVAEGLIDQPIDSSITASQTLTAIVDTGFIDQTGTWRGIVSSDSEFSSIQSDIGIANGVAIITPSQNADGTWPLDMTGFKDVAFAIKVTSAGTYVMAAIQGPTSFGGLTPVNSGEGLKVAYDGDGTDAGLLDCFYDGETLSPNVWNIFMVLGRTKGQKHLQFKVTNNSGSSSNIDTAFMRLV